MAEMENDVTAEVLEVIPEEEVRICLFVIGEDRYALPVGVLTEIIIPQKIFPVPTTPSFVLGVINLRGSIVPIVDIRPALSLPLQTIPGQIALVKHDNLFFGIIVDSVSEIVSLPESSFLPLPTEHTAQHVPAGRNRFFKAVVQRENGMAALLDIDRIVEAIKLS